MIQLNNKIEEYREISKKLCEVCDLKPQYGNYINLGDLDSNYQIVVYPTKEKFIENECYEDNTEVNEYYVNFGYAKNFVDLLELKINDEYTLLGCMTNLDLPITDRLTTLNCLYNLLSKANGDILEIIKEKIREYNWDYTQEVIF